MPATLDLLSEGNVLTIHVSGKLTSDDDARFVPEVDRLIQEQGKIRILFDMEDFHGWSMGAMWKDFKFGVHHYADIERMALVGDKDWEKHMSTFCKPFTRAEVRYFDRSQTAEARQWLTQN